MFRMEYEMMKRFAIRRRLRTMLEPAAAAETEISQRGTYFSPTIFLNFLEFLRSGFRRAVLCSSIPSRMVVCHSEENYKKEPCPNLQFFRVKASPTAW